MHNLVPVKNKLVLNRVCVAVGVAKFDFNLIDKTNRFHGWLHVYARFANVRAAWGNFFTMRMQPGKSTSIVGS
jgi:hypothetical protein